MRGALHDIWMFFLSFAMIFWVAAAVIVVGGWFLGADVWPWAWVAVPMAIGVSVLFAESADW